MKILRLESENIKRINAVEITPTGNLVEITGRNGNGKTSVLDSIFFALAGAKHIQAEPIRKGAKSAEIRLRIGDTETRYVVTRKFHRPKNGDAYASQLIVEAADGTVLSKPQAVIDALIGELSFDPMAFCRKRPDEQADMLRALVPGVDWQALDAADKADYAARTEVNRKAKDMRAQADGISYPDGTPTELQSAADVAAELQIAQEHNAKIEVAKRDFEREQLAIRQMFADAQALRQKAADLRREADLMDARADELNETAERRVDALESAEQQEPVDLAPLMDRLQSIDRINEAVRARQRRAGLIEAAISHEEESARLTARMEARQAEREKAIEDSPLPVSGLAFTGAGVTLDGLPLDQISDAAQRQVSVSIAMALNPTLRVARIRDGSLLDKAAMQHLAELADAHDFQIWVETVESGRPGAIVIEDGRIGG